MKPFKNIRPKRKYRLKHILLLGCIFCAIISYNIGFSNKVFGGILDGSLVDANTPTCGYMATIKGENYFGGCSTEQYNDCTNGNVILDWLTRLLYNGFGYETQCIKQCSENNVVEFTGQLTNEDVLVTLTGCNKPVTVTNNSGSNQYLFTENGEFTFEFKDDNGRTGETLVRINGINRIDPECDIFYEPNTRTSGNVSAKLTGCNKQLTGTIKPHIFTGNGTFVFQLEDIYGNTGFERAKVTWIDRERPNCIVDYNPKSGTTGEVLAILTGCNEKITTSETMFLFMDNGSYTFRYQDLAGNVSTTGANVDWILPDEALTGISHTINDNKITLTWEKMEGYDGDVDFYLWYEDSGEYKLLGTSALEDESFSFDIKREGRHMIKIVPRNGGNIKYYSVPYEDTHPTITPICEIEYPDPDKNPTNQDVIVKLTNCNEKVYVTNNGGNVFHTFSNTGTFIFEFRDDYDNTGETTATVYWIDKVAPTCEVTYSPHEDLTTEPVIAKIHNCSEEIHFSDGYEETYTFTQNGKHIFYFLDNVGNIGTAEAIVSCITGDNESEPSYAITGINHMESDGDIILTWDVLNGRYINIWINYNGNGYTLLDSDINVNDQRYSFVSLGTGTYSIKFVPQNNLLESIYTFDVIVEEDDNNLTHKIHCEIIFSPGSGEVTSGDVVAMLTGCNSDSIISNTTHIFTGNVIYTFEFEDIDGNTGQKIAEVTWIDKTPPQCSISHSTATYGDVIATISCDDPNTIIINNNSQSTHIFTGNGEFTFEVSDVVGNTASYTTKVDRIEHIISCKIVYSIPAESGFTNHDVTAELTGCDREIIIESSTYTFTGNGTYIFNFKDTDGNPGQKIAEVTWIDKIPPQCSISYSTKQITNHNVNATISCDDENIIIKNNNHSATHVFTGNGDFIFRVSDLAGNTVSVPAQVTCIDKEAPTCEVTYSTRQQTTGEVFATLTNCSEQVLTVPGYNLYHRFLSNGSSSIIFRDIAGNVGSARAEVDWIVVESENHDNDETGAVDTPPEYPITGVNHFIYNGIINLTWTALVSGYMDISIRKDEGYIKLDTIQTYSELYSLDPVSSYRVKFSPLDTNLKTVYYDIDIPVNPDPVNPDPVDPDPVNPDPVDPDPVNPDPVNPDPVNPDPVNPDPVNPDPVDSTPTCKVSYSVEQETNDAVIATLYGCSEKVSPLPGYSLSHIFVDNGNHMFYFIDDNGNVGTAWANVTWIKHEVATGGTVNFVLTGLTHSISGNKIKLIWTALSNGIVEIYLWDSYTKEYTKLGSTSINYEEFLTDITRGGEYLFKLDPINGDTARYSVYIDNYTGSAEIPDCMIKFDYMNNGVVAILTGCSESISITNNGGSSRHVFEDGENMFTFEFKDSEGNLGRLSAYTRYFENFDHYNDNFLGNNTFLGNPTTNSMNNYVAFYSDEPFKGSFSVTGTNISLDNGAIFESNITCVLSTGNTLTINIDGLGSKPINDIIVPGNYAGLISYALPRSYYTNQIFVNFGLDLNNRNGGYCLIDDVSIISKPNTVASTEKTGAKTGTYYKSHNIEISGLPENTAIPVSVSIDYTDTVIKGYGNCVNNDGSNIDYCEGKYTTDIVLYKNGDVVSRGETVGQNGDVFQIKVKSSIYENSNITANLMFGHTKKSIISQFSVSTETGENMHGSADFEFDYSKFDSAYEFEWNKAYQYSYFYGFTTQSPIANADMNGSLTRIAMAKMLSKYAINILGYTGDNDKECSFRDVSSTKDKMYDNGVTNACKLGIMGINMPNNEFRPYDLVTRAEFATALSRLLYNTEDGKIYYYSTHITKLRAENIITDTNPSLIEKRGYVMLMLMRSRQGDLKK